MFGFPESPNFFLPKKTPVFQKNFGGRKPKEVTFENLHLRLESKKISWRTSLPEVFFQHRAHPGRSQSQNITDMAKNFQHPYQQKSRIQKNWWKKYLPLPFPVQPNLYYLQHSPPNTHPWLGNCNTRKVKIHSRLLCNPPKGRFRVTCWGAIRRKYVGWVPEKNWVYICSYMWGNGESPKNAMLVVLLTLLQIYFWYYHKNTKDKVFPFWFQSCI